MMARRDLDEVVSIERLAFEFPWTEEDFKGWLSGRNCIGMVAERGELVVGFMVYELHKDSLSLLNLAVAADFVRRGVGRALMDKLKSKLGVRRKYVSCVVRERNVAGQLFLQSQGFRCIEPRCNHWDECDDDAYLFVFDPAD